MISNKLNKFDIFKVYSGITSPVYAMVVVIFGLLSLVPSNGSSSQSIAIIVFSITLALLLVNIVVGKLCERIPEYFYSSPSILEKIRLEIWIPLLVFGLIVILPFYIVFISSVKTTGEAVQPNFTWWPTSGFNFKNYSQILDLKELGIDLILSFYNSFVYALIPTSIGVLISCSAAFAFAKLKFPGSEILYNFMILTMVIPGCIATSSSYSLMDAFGWTHDEGFSRALLIPGMFGSVGCMMFLREFLTGIPDSLIESARIDGANKFHIFTSIVLPLCKAAVLAQFILGFIGSYNNFTGPLIYLTYTEQFTLTFSLQFIDESGAEVATKAAAAVVALVPMLIIYCVFQKTILTGIELSSGVKG